MAIFVHFLAGINSSWSRMPSQCPIQSFLLGRWAIWWEYLVGTLMKSLISSHSLIPLQCLCQCYLLLVDIILARSYACCWICTLPTAQCTLQSAKCTLHCEMPDARILNFATKAATVWTEETGENPSTMQNLHPPWLVLFQIRRFITVFTLLSFF